MLGGSEVFLIQKRKKNPNSRSRVMNDASWTVSVIKATTAPNYFPPNMTSTSTQMSLGKREREKRQNALNRSYDQI